MNTAKNIRMDKKFLPVGRQKTKMQNAIKFYWKHKKLCLTLIGLMVAIAIYAVPSVVFAADDPAVGGILKDINDLFNFLIRISSAWLWPVLLMIGSLLDNDLIFGGEMGERLRDVWVQIRNLVNIAFVIILLIIAVYNILGLGEEGGGSTFGFKQAMPKFVLALIAVNFSFLAVKVVLDFTNVLTGAVFALPTTTLVEEGGTVVKLGDKVEEIICGTSSKEMPGRPMWCEKNKLNARAKAFFSRLDRSNITLAYAVRFGRAPQLKFIKEGIKDIGQLGFNMIFNAVLYVVYAVSFIALFIVLLVRIIVLWVCAVLSPVIALGIALPNLKELLGDAGNLKEKFVNDAIAPIKIGLVLSVGYIMLDGLEADKSIHGELLAGSSLTAVDPNALPTDITDLQQLIIAVAVIAIIWVAVFAVAEKTTAKGITGFIKENVGGFGKWMAKLPLYAQVIPVSGSLQKGLGKYTGIKEIMGVFTGAKEGIEAKGGEIEGRAFGRSLFGLPVLLAEERMAWKAALSGGATDIARAMNTSASALKDSEGWELFKQSMMKYKNIKDDKTFEDQYGKGPLDFEKAARRFEQDPVLMAALKTESKGRLDTAQAIIDEIKRSRAAGAAVTGPVNTEDQVKEALEKGDAKTLAGKDAFEGWEVKDVKQLQDVRKEIRDAMITLTDGKVDKSILSQISAAKILGSLLEANNNRSSVNASNPADDPIVKAITDARTANIPDAVIKAAISTFLSGDLKKQALSVLNPPVQPPPPPAGATP